MEIPDLRYITENVKEVLDMDFDFGTKGIDNIYVGDITTKSVQDEFLNLQTNGLKITDSEAKKDMQKLLQNPGYALCVFTSHISGKKDYSMFVSNSPSNEINEAEYPFYNVLFIAPTVGHEMIHGEHRMNHADRSSLGFEKYLSLFSGVAMEFVAYLGKGYLGDYLKISTKALPIDLEKESVAGNEDNWLGYHIERQMRDFSKTSNKKIPYKKLFHANNEKELWKIVNEFMRPERPRIQVLTSKSHVQKNGWNFYVLSRTLQDSGVEADLTMHVKGD